MSKLLAELILEYFAALDSEAQAAIEGDMSTLSDRHRQTTAKRTGVINLANKILADQAIGDEAAESVA